MAATTETQNETATDTQVVQLVIQKHILDMMMEQFPHIELFPIPVEDDLPTFGVSPKL